MEDRIKIKEGDVVYLKYEHEKYPVLMSVEKINTGTDTATCLWMVNNDLKSFSIPIDALLQDKTEYPAITEIQKDATVYLKSECNRSQTLMNVVKITDGNATCLWRVDKELKSATIPVFLLRDKELVPKINFSAITNAFR
jgi:hypothetical protein